MSQRILITGGAGFIGSNLAILLKRDRPNLDVTAFDSLKRRGSELNLERLGAAGVHFVHGDIRNPEDLDAVGDADVLIECSAEPSVQAGYDGDSRYLVNTNLVGTANCLEYARSHRSAIVFLSTSRVYPIAALRGLPLERSGDRLALTAGASGVGWSAQGIGPEFPLAGSRTLYGATKLCSELLLWEYGDMYDLPVIVNRCGVVTGPGQLGRVDQGFVALWAARHLFGGELRYCGFGGEGLQVRDILHVEDLYELIVQQLDRLDEFAGNLYCLGGGPERSVSLLELTALCAEATGKRLPITSAPDTHPADIPYFVSDNREVTAATGWEPRRSIADILSDIIHWLDRDRARLERVFT